MGGAHADRIRASLPDAIVVATLEDALEVASRQGPVAVVTLEGETLRGAMVEGGRDVKGLLAPRREVKEVAARQEEMEGRLLALRSAAAETAGIASAAAAEARSLEERIHAAEKDLVAVRHEVQTAEEESGRLHRKASILDTERAQAEQERAAAAAAPRRDRAGARLPPRRSARRATAASPRSAPPSPRAAPPPRRPRRGTPRRAARSRRCASGRPRPRTSAAASRGTSRSSSSGSPPRAPTPRRRRAAGATSRPSSPRSSGSWPPRSLERDRAQGETAVAEDRVREGRGEIESREQGLKERRRECFVLRDALAEVDVDRARTGSDLDHLARECQQSVGIAAAEAAATLTDEDRARDLDALAALVQELRDKLERMGQVNVLAVEQAQELEERHTFLTAQRQDLLDSISELDQAIRKIDRASRERFQEAFQIINQHFGEMFKQLFGGGTAGLSLLDEEDLLESGIDIMAQPPGKRLQNVLLLSGGEKALTAIALLFAIFQYKPSPFCILDEVDAPLDDANIGRFVSMLEGLKEQTQFVLITHSRKTMSIADQLYGVTMEEPGVRKLVSVRFT